MTDQNNRMGILLMCATSFIFAMQDGLSRHLGGNYNPYMVVMIRYWFFASFVIVMVSRQKGGILRAVQTHFPKLQILRGVILVAEICIMVIAFVELGLIESHAVFTCYPLLVAALSGPILGEKVGWRRWVAIGIGFVGVLIILQPGVAVFSPLALVPLLCAFLFALYGLLTRYVAQRDTASVSFFWTGIVGVIAVTPVGLWHWQPMSAPDWGLMGILCLTAATAHYCMIRAYELAEASAIQPFAFLQLVFVSVLAITMFNETLQPHVALGAGVVVAAALFTLWRQQRAARRDAKV